MSSSLAHLPYIGFLTAYPHPAFVVQGIKHTVRAHPDINPVLGNPSFRSLLLGRDADTTELGRTFLRALETVEAVESFARWLDAGRSNPRLGRETLRISLKLPGTALDADRIELDLTQTVLGDFTVCTSTPCSSLSESPPFETAPSPPDSSAAAQGRRNWKMRLPDLPPPLVHIHSNPATKTPDAISMLMRTPTGSGQSSHSPEHRFSLSSSAEYQGNKGDMREMIENYSWHLTPLGPRTEWTSVLRAIIDYMLAHPFPMSLWWTDELVLLYNDAYKDVIAHKHPSIFAEHGSVSWAELWDSIGPRARNVLAGEAVSERDDLLFIERMTETKLPEETYHSWCWVPVKEEGIVKGFLNGTFETTTKVITERRMDFLRDFATKAALSRSASEFAKALLLALESFVIDCPFGALYLASITESGHSSVKTTCGSYIRKPVDDLAMTVKLTCAGTVGVPMPHPSVPQMVDFVIDHLEIRPSPQARAQAASPVPSLYSQDSQVTAVPLDEGRSPTPSTSSGRTAGFGPGGSFGGTANRGSSAKNVNASTDVGQNTPTNAVLWPFAEAFATRRPVHVPTLPDYAVEGFELRGWGEPARAAIVIPICVEEADVPAAVLVMGLNSRRPYDDQYAQWIDLFRLAMNAILTAVKGREADVKRAEHLAELDSAKTAFFSNASHELRTPLTLIQGPLQDAVASLPNSRIRDTLRIAVRNVMRLSRLVDSLMDFGKLAANRLEGRFRPVHLGECTADLASLFGSVIEKCRIEYVVDCDLTDRKQTYIDPDFWEKIVFNLIGNAFKYTLRGSIHVILRYDSEYAYFHVKDTGVGIPPSDVDRVFDRFHRVDAISRSHEGTGIGLALTRELVKLHGGTLSVTSTTEQESPASHGSCFTVKLPLGKDHLPAAHVLQSGVDVPQNRLYAQGIVDEAIQWAARDPEERTPSEASDSGGSSESSGKMDPSTLFFVKSDIILLVDDNGDMRRYIKSLFTPFCQVVEASNGQEALNLLNEIKPNLILSDVMMPILDGYALISHVRQRPETRLTPIILVTAKESEEARVEGLLSGADDYMSKPFTGKELIARVHLQMQLGKRRIELEGKFVERTREIQLLSDLSPVGVCRADENRRILYVNQRWYEISGHNPSDSLEEWFNCVQEIDQQVAKDLWEAAFATQKSSSMETRFKNGVFAKWSLQPLHSAEGAPIGLISTITDVSDQRYFEESRLQHAQEREALARKRAEEAEERRKEADERRRGQELLIDVTSHELRQPVSAILNCSSLVRSNLARHRSELERAHASNTSFVPSKDLLRGIDEDLDALDAIYQCGLAQERIANDVLSLSRIQLQILSIQPVEFDLVPEIRRIVSIFRNELKMKRINFGITFGDSLKKLGVRRVRSDKSRFGQVITNLLSNGIKFTDTSIDKRDIFVTVEVSRRAPSPDEPCVPPRPVADDGLESVGPDIPSKIYVYVAVRDSGPGLMPDDLALLFKRFQQGSNSHNVFGGSGLGLFVSRKLCELMGGRIDVDSTFGEGATFRFFVEAMTVPTSPDSHDASVPDGYTLNSLASMGEVRATMPLHILITEDNLINQTVLDRQLIKAGCTTTLANNGLQAIKEIRSIAESDGPHNAFDAVLMDCEMPVMDGLTAVREIRKMEQTGELPVRNRIYALTGNAREGQIESALEAGMDEVIIKPYRLDELLSKIQSSVGGQNAMR